MAINVTKPAINLREKLNEVTLETGIKGEELLNSDTSTEARNVLELDTHLFTDFESTGIDDNATSTAITIDASENVLIGMTAVSGTTDGLHLRSGIASGVNVTNDHCFALNRKSSDGEALRFLKDGALVGSIDVSASGASIKLGGTAAANALDDYEEGTWTPAITGPSGSAVPGMAYTTQVGSYTKVGNIVSVRIALNFTANSGNPLRRVSLPFTGTGQTGILAGAGISPSNLNFGNGTQACAYAAPGNAYLALTISGDELAQQYPSATSQSMSIRVSMTYEV